MSTLAKAAIHARVLLATGAIALLLIVPTGLSSGQTPATQLTVTQVTVTAGDTITGSITLDQPVACDTQVGVVFDPINGGPAFSIYSQVTKGQEAISLKGQVPFDQSPGEYRSTRGYVSPCPNYSQLKNVQVPLRVVNVRPYQDTNIPPTKAELQLSPTQQQFLDTKAEELDHLDAQLTTKIEGQSSDSVALRDTLIQTVEAAEAALNLTAQQYRTQILKPNEPLPDFFADFQRQYEVLKIDLRAPIPGTSAMNGMVAQLLYVQLQRRAQKPDVTHSGGDLTYPPAAVSVRKTMHDNEAAYKYVAKSGRVTFDARLSSVPTGAYVRYKKLIDNDFKDYSAPTDVPKVTLELATWIFEFRKDGCGEKPIIRRIDPYDDANPDISVEFSQCKQR